MAGDVVTGHARASTTAWLSAVLALAVVLAAFKLLPGQLPNAQSMLGDAAYAQCLHETRLAGHDGCLNFGWPHGAPKSFGLPVNLLADAVFGGDGRIDPHEVRDVYAAFVALAFVLATLLFRRITGHAVLGVLGASLYLLSPVVQQQSGYAALQLGLALVPGYLLLDLWLFDALRARRLPHTLALVVLVAGVRIGALFLDGYSFLVASALTSVVAAWALAANRGGRAAAAGLLAIHVAACALAAWAYRQYLPPIALGVMPLDFFRGAGVDVLTMLVPLRDTGLYGALGLGVDIRPEMSYGGRASLIGVFTGYASLLAVAVLCRAWARRRIPPPSPLVAGIFLAGIAGVLLSLGPSFKFNDFRDDQTRASALGFRAYLMPADAATLDLHTGAIYQQVPGIRHARVLARWQVLARLALVTALLLAVGLLWQGGRRWPAILLAAFALFEAAPDPRTVADESRQARERTQLVDDGYAAAFAGLATPGERILLLPLHAGASANEYAANFLCARARVHCYNTGGDKALVVARAAWPPEVAAAKRRKAIGANVADAFRNGLVDAVVVPHFDLRLVVYPWAPVEVDEASIADALAREFAGPAFVARREGAFTVIRPAAPGEAP